MGNWQIERLSPTHERGQFESGHVSLDHFLRSLATQYARRDLGITYVAVKDEDRRVLGFYTLASSSLLLATLPQNLAKRLPKHPVPVVLLGRLAVDRTQQGKGLGKELVLNALDRCVSLSRELGIHAIEVHAIDETARTFYERFGFEPLKDHGRHLYLLIDTIRHSLGEASLR